MEECVRLQVVSQRALTALVNGGRPTAVDVALSFAGQRLPLRRHAPRVAACWRAYTSSVPTLGTAPVSVEVPPYRGSHPGVIRMADALREIEDDLVGAYVHGSLATADTTGYSDFDALVILKDKLAQSAGDLVRVSAVLSRLRGIMFDCDPLQHHGWFVLTESDLDFYCNAWFPVELFEYAARLTRNTGHALRIVSRPSAVETREAFLRVCEAVLARTRSRVPPRNLYLAKSLLSEFMLLPALYLQTVTGRGLYKKFSFEMARKDFDPELWKVMDRVSDLRLIWTQPVPAVWRRILVRPMPLRRQLARHLPLAVPRIVADRLNADLLDRMSELTRAMMDKVSRTNPPG